MGLGWHVALEQELDVEPAAPTDGRSLIFYQRQLEAAAQQLGLARNTVRAAVRATRIKPGVDLLVESDDYFRNLNVAWKGGDRFPDLERGGGRDWLSEILSARESRPQPAK